MSMVQTFAIPTEKSTKRLKFKVAANNTRKIVISSNWLPLMNFNAHDRIQETSLGRNKGMEIRRVLDLFAEQPDRTKKVYQRKYKTRRNNPLEVLLEVGSQKIINESFPADCKNLHIIFETNKITILPITEFQCEAIKNATPESRYDVFAALTSGVDLYSMEKTHGLKIHSALEWRPHEVRDKNRDLSETGALTILRNITGIKNLFNEDIGSINTSFLKDAMGTPVTTMIASLACDDFCNVKGSSLKQKSLEDLSSSIDMAYDLLRIIEAIKPPVICLEQVRGFYSSEIFRMIDLRLRRWGYSSNLLIGDGRDYGGLTSRVRGYAVFTCLDSPFMFEQPGARRTDPIWNLITRHLPDCRDVTHSKSLQNGLKSGRLRTITAESLHSPTILKSFARMARDSVCIKHNDRLYWPSEDLIKELMGISPNFKLDCVSAEIASEIIGQSIQVELHDSVMRSLACHLNAYFDNAYPTPALAA